MFMSLGNWESSTSAMPGSGVITGASAFPATAALADAEAGPLVGAVADAAAAALALPGIADGALAGAHAAALAGATTRDDGGVVFPGIHTRKPASDTPVSKASPSSA
jgi:hypothetical protein